MRGNVSQSSLSNEAFQIDEKGDLLTPLETFGLNPLLVTRHFRLRRKVRDALNKTAVSILS